MGHQMLGSVYILGLVKTFFFRSAISRRIAWSSFSPVSVFTLSHIIWVSATLYIFIIRYPFSVRSRMVPYPYLSKSGMKFESAAYKIKTYRRPYKLVLWIGAVLMPLRIRFRLRLSKISILMPI